MLKRRNYFLLLLIYFIPGSAFSEILELNADYFVRSSPDFLSKTNKVDVFNKGTQVEVLEVQKLPSGAEGLKVRMVKGSSKNTFEKEVWIYRSNKSHFTSIESSPKEPKAIAAWTEPNYPTQEESTKKTEAQATQIPCKDCETVPKNLKENAKNISKIVDTITQQENQAPPATTSKKEASAAEMSLVEKVKNYSASKSVQKVIQAAKKNAYRRSIRKCYRFVKNALAHGLTPGWYSDVAAKSAKESLKKYNFINLLDHEPYKSNLKKPDQAPKGAVLVYSSGKACGRIKDCGHIEIKLGEGVDGGYASDYYSQHAINDTPAARKYGSRYKLIGVMVKPMDSI